MSGDIVDRLQWARAALRVRGLDGLQECVRLFAAVGRLKDTVLPERDPNYEGAKVEFGRLGPEFQYLVQGHTHRARHDFRAAGDDGRVRLYINTGTHLPVVQPADDGRGFAAAQQMTLAFFRMDGETPAGQAGTGPTLDLWSGIKRKTGSP